MSPRKRQSSRLLVASLLAVFALAAHAQQYRWVDDKGRVQYTDTPPPAQARNVQKKNLTAGPPASDGQPYALQVAVRNAPVKFYSTPDCGPNCDEGRRLLNRRGIPFAEISITEAAQIEELKRVSGGTSVPVMLVGSSLQKGYQEQAFHSLLDSAGYPAPGALRPRNQAAPAPKPAAEPAEAKPPATPQK